MTIKLWQMLDRQNGPPDHARLRTRLGELVGYPHPRVLAEGRTGGRAWVLIPCFGDN